MKSKNLFRSFVIRLFDCSIVRLFCIWLLVACCLLPTFSFAQSPNYLWAKSAGGTSDDIGYSCTTDAGGNAFVTGSFSSDTITFGTTTLTNAGGYDIFIVKYSPAGTVLWAKSAGGTSDDYGNRVSTDAAGNVFVTGSFYSPTITFGTTTLTNAGSYDMFIAKLDSVLTTGIESLQSGDEISVYPNPTGGIFNVQMSKLEDVQMEIYNIYGECIHQHISTSANQQIDLSESSSGIYFLTIKLSGAKSVRQRTNLPSALTSGGTEQGIINKKLIINK